MMMMSWVCFRAQLAMVEALGMDKALIIGEVCLCVRVQMVACG